MGKVVSNKGKRVMGRRYGRWPSQTVSTTDERGSPRRRNADITCSLLEVNLRTHESATVHFMISLVVIASVGLCFQELTARRWCTPG